jgi:hypothetical protein
LLVPTAREEQRGELTPNEAGDGMAKNSYHKWAAFRTGVSIGTIFVLALVFTLIFPSLLYFAFAVLNEYKG